ncbi:MAG TPA: hypothetical protein VLE54_05865 [Thermoanaerobaculia bacterium]|nr:hypothetical protein [Thermoanaerobaculia bacterium]
MRAPALVFMIGLASSVAIAQQADVPLTNWTVPPYRAASAQGGLTTMADVTPGVAFVGVAPCRLVDTRQAGFPAGYGTPALVQGVPRNFDLNSDPQCTGIPSGVDAYSLNITVTNTQGPGFILIYPQGGSQPTVSTVNYVANQTIANAAIVPASAGGGVTVIAGVSGTDLIIDINGYFTDTYNASGSSLFRVFGLAPWAITGTTTSTADLATGVLGQAAGTLGNTIGVWGETFSSTDLARGVMGFAQSANGITYGVQGLTNSISAGAAGVFGVDGYGQFFNGAGFAGGGSNGVRGISRFGTGVTGIGQGQGTEGVRVDSNGAFQTSGILGWSSTRGVQAFGDIGATGAKPFIEPHPTDASKEIAFVALEGPEAGTYFRGRGKFQRGVAEIPVPESFRLVSDSEGLTIQVTPIGQMATVAVVSLGLDRIVVQGSRDVEFFYTVNGVRKAFKDWEVIRQNEVYVPRSPDQRMPTAFAPEQRRRLIATGIYNEDGTVNVETAQRLGWDKEWERRSRPAPQPASE